MKDNYKMAKKTLSKQFKKIVVSWKLINSKVFLFLLLFCLLNLSIIYKAKSQENLEVLWRSTIKNYLNDPLWTERDAYDAGHYLMVPIHAAFLLENEDWINDFCQHINRFIQYGFEEFRKIESTGNRLQYLYFLSRFLVLAETSKRSYLIPDKLPDFIYKEIESIWIMPAWFWGREPFPNGMKERILYKLEKQNLPFSYYQAIIDYEIYVFAIAADLKRYEETSKIEKGWLLITEILDISYRVFSQEGVFQLDGGWLFQPGIWKDHPDYVYAGQDAVLPNLSQKPVGDIAVNTSHSHRLPLWLISLQNAYSKDSEEYNLYSKIRRALAKQFYGKVLVPPSDDCDFYRTTNFMDGKNGVYRYNYQTLGENKGYGPYQLSGTMLLGWWTFLYSGKEYELYSHLTNQFPLSAESMEIYGGTGTTRERHPLLMNTQYTNGMLELITSLSAEIQKSKGDIDKNQIIDLSDLKIIIGNFGREDINAIIASPDVNQDGIVDILDILYIIILMQRFSYR